MYIELHARSAFSFLEGSSLPEEMAGICARLNMPAMALLDTNGVYGAPRFHLAAKKIGIKAHIGAEVACAAFPRGTNAAELPIANCQLPNYNSTIAPARIGNQKSELGNSSRPPLRGSSRARYQNLCLPITKMRWHARKGQGAVRQEAL